MKVEINLSLRLILNTLAKLSQFHNGKPLKISNYDIVAYLNSLRKPENADPLHGWIEIYNLHLTTLSRFFKWLYTPELEPKKRPKPVVVQNISSFWTCCRFAIIFASYYLN